MEFAERSIRKLAAAWSKLRQTRNPSDSKTCTPAKAPDASVRHRGFGLIDIRPREDKLALSFPDDATLLRGVAETVGAFAGDRPRTFFERTLRNGIKPMMDNFGATRLVQAKGDELRFIELVRFLLARRAAGRYQDYFVRKEMHGSELPPHVLTMSQGVLNVMNWRGIPLIKTVFDISLYMMMLWDLKPRTIIETGSGCGGSATWLADLMDGYDLDCHIYSLDIRKPALSHPGVTFLEGDCKKIEESLPQALLERLPHPWLVVEDAHVNVAGVLEWIHTFTHPGDYIVVEDTTGVTKQADTAPFIAAHQSEYKVDTYYTDFFGYNACSSRDSIWRRF
jgi:cephalosporin hydroxylase